MLEKGKIIQTELDAILKDASIVNCPFNMFKPLTLNLITLAALPSNFYHQ